MAFNAALGRGAFAVDTCGGCGVVPLRGSAVQRAARLLADGPPRDVKQLPEADGWMDVGVV